MAEKFMTRRERREAERHAADAAFDAQQAAESDDGGDSDDHDAPVNDAPANSAKSTGLFPSAAGSSWAQSAPAAAAPTGDVKAPTGDVKPQAHITSQAPPAKPAPVIPAAPTTLPVPDTPPTPVAQEIWPSQPDVPAATSAQAQSSGSQDIPLFASRSERKRFLREHDLPSDISTSSIPIVLAQRESGDDSETDVTEADVHETNAGSETAQQDHADIAQQDVAQTDQEESPVDRDAESAPAPADSGAQQTSAWEALTAHDAVDSAPATSHKPFSIDSDVGLSAGASAWQHSDAVDEAETVSLASDKERSDSSGPVSGMPTFDLARRRVDASPTGQDFETSSTAVISPAALGDFDAPLRRRSPVVKPPTGSNIRVVTGALPIVTPEDLAANPPTTPLSAIDESMLGTGTFSTASNYSSPSTVATAPRPDPWSLAGLADDEEEDSNELDEPPAKPMSARSVTNEDGTILVAERNSMVPYIVLGAAGFVALALVVIALFLLL